MSISPHLQRKLQEALGQEAAEDLVGQLNDSQSLRADVAELRHEMQLGFARLDAKIELNVGRFDGKMDAMEQRLTALIATSNAALLKWSFVFWVGAVGAIAALAGVLR